MTKSLQEKIVLVTGAGGGIGRATALAFAACGSKVVVSDIRTHAGQATIDAIRTMGGEALFIQADVTRSADVENMVGTAVEVYGRLDCAFNNAGINLGRASTTVRTEDEWDRIIAVNLKGVWLCLKYEILQMVAQGGGAIVNTSSTAGLIGNAGKPAYTASKHGVVGLTKTAALEFAKQGVRVNAVCPGAVGEGMDPALKAGNDALRQSLMNQYPMGRFARHEEVSATVIWLCSEAAAFITGQSIAVDGGRTVG